MTAKSNSTKIDSLGDLKDKQTCGIIMPISASESYSVEHWNDVRLVLEEVINDIGYVPNMVSEADEIGIIHNRIVTNIYNNPIVVCDVSSKNPNVMFELGLRLAFDKATIIIKDTDTHYNFDTAPIEHLTYPRDLRYTSINKFKAKLKEKLLSTIQASQNPNYSTFLKNFVQYKPTLQTEEISSEKFILKQLDEINKQLSHLRSSGSNSEFVSANNDAAGKTVTKIVTTLYEISKEELDNFTSLLDRFPSVIVLSEREQPNGVTLFRVAFPSLMITNRFNQHWREMKTSVQIKNLQ